MLLQRNHLLNRTEHNYQSSYHRCVYTHIEQNISALIVVLLPLTYIGEKEIILSYPKTTQQETK